MAYINRERIDQWDIEVIDESWVSSENAYAVHLDIDGVRTYMTFSSKEKFLDFVGTHKRNVEQ